VRTTLNIDAPLFEEVRRLAVAEAKSIGRVVSELLAEALHGRRRGKARTGTATFTWVSKPMQARVRLEQAGALYELADAADRAGAVSVKPRRRASRR
jgi:hypothetical protein